LRNKRPHLAAFAFGWENGLFFAHSPPKAAKNRAKRLTAHPEGFTTADDAPDSAPSSRRRITGTE
jgi:hypothetical protein